MLSNFAAIQLIELYENIVFLHVNLYLKLRNADKDKSECLQ